MTGKLLRDGFIAGTFSGVALGVFLKLVESFTDIKVYTLLLNVDFIPAIGDIAWPEIIEFLFHMIIAWLLGIVVAFLLFKLPIMSPLKVVVICFAITLPTFFLYFPLTYLSQKDTPALTDFIAFFWWVVGHILFALILSLSFIITNKVSK
ncbi:hypothetical protein EJF36_08410 [Bacillus sp. HMF5848]|uniref:hypothetical protein n=1 Tax=Bacillus sp. HMF5848 TaxID=2495421 RepID=UPI000F7B6E21|nr:hypothetical protein [Bacillus sp. HMF5848]RSK26887.1 hypothetical protein EJF36_08410 [Bacillus sp. HMF5848]